jgi:hypothetical protein
MRLLHVLEEMRPSGAERVLLAAAPYWQAAGIELKAVAAADAFGEFATAQLPRPSRFFASRVLASNQRLCTLGSMLSG